MRLQHTCTLFEEVTSGSGWGGTNTPTRDEIGDGPCQVYDSGTMVKRGIAGDESPDGMAFVRLGFAPTEAIDVDKHKGEFTYNGVTRTGRIVSVSHLRKYPRVKVQWG